MCKLGRQVRDVQRKGDGTMLKNAPEDPVSSRNTTRYGTRRSWGGPITDIRVPYRMLCDCPSLTNFRGHSRANARSPDVRLHEC